MAKDENGLGFALDDDASDPQDAEDEVVDLLEVVKPGKTLAASDADEDFSADLESMLETLSQAEKAKADEDDPLRFPDPTPVDYEVDHDESLDLPAMDDVDRILKSVGAPSKQPRRDDDAAPDLPYAASDIPDLDALPAAAASSTRDEPLDDDQDLLAELGLDDQPGAPSFAEAAHGMTAPMDLDGLPEDIAGAMPEEPSTGPPIDDDELVDAVLDALAPNTLPDAPNTQPGALPDLEAFEQLDELALIPDPDAPGADSETDTLLNSAATAAGDIASESLDSEVEASCPYEPSPACDIGAEALSGPNPDLPDGRDEADDAREAASGLDDPDVPDSGVNTVQNTGVSSPSTIKRTLVMEEMKITTTSSGESGASKPSATDNDDASAGRFDEVDLNELDALLDDMLATAPASGPGPASPSTDSSEQSLTEAMPETASSISDSTGSDNGISAELALLRQELHVLNLEFESMRHGAAASPSPSSLAIEAKIEDIDLTLQNLDSRMHALEHQFNELTINLDKFAAEAAAKIIREELAALLQG